MKKPIETCFIVLLSIAFLIGVYGCGGDSSTGPSSQTLVSITVTPANPTISTTLQFTATGTYSDNSIKNITSSVTWSSSNTEVATIMNSGLAISIHAGSTAITATSGSVSGSTLLTVTSAILSSISITPANPSVPVGGTVQLTATGTYSDKTTHDLTGQVTWLSSKTGVATINGSGLATGIAAGSSAIIASSGSVSGSANLSVTSTTGAFKIETIAQGNYPAIAVDGSGNPHISYLSNTDNIVKYAFKEGSGFTVSSVGNVANSNGTPANGGLSSIALDAAYTAHITYYDYGSGNYKYAKRNGTGWTISAISLPDDPLMSYSSKFLPWAESSIVIDKISGTAHVSLQMLGGLSGYVLGYWKTGLSHAIIVDGTDGNSGYQNAIALDNHGYPLISYEARQAGKLKYASWGGSTFSTETIGIMPGTYWESRLSSIAVDHGGNPHIAFYGQNKYQYAGKNGVAWNVESLPESDGYPSISLCLDGTDNPHIALVSYSKLRYGYWNGSSWLFTTVDNDVYDCAIATDNSGRIHIAYSQGNVNRVIKYALK